MADTIKQLVTRMESAYLSIFVEAASKLANLAESKMFIVFESASGQRRIGGDDDLLADFKAGRLWPKNNDELLKKAGQDMPPRNLKSGTLSQQRCLEQEEEDYDMNETRCDTFERQTPSLVGQKRKKQDAQAEIVETKRVKTVGGDQPKDHSIELNGAENAMNCAKNLENGPELLKIKSDQNDDDDLEFNSNDDDFDELVSNQDVEDDEVSGSQLGEKADEKKLDENPGQMEKKKENEKGALQQERKRCKLCPDTERTKRLFYTIDEYKKHKQNFHDKNVCKLCPDLKTYTRDAYYKHKRAVHDRMHLCLTCDKGFSCKSALNRHVSQTGHTPKELAENTSSESNPSDLTLAPVDSSV